ncbi:MAG TPA: pseudouridine synthase [Thermoanaerobaculia bacterium]
MIAPRVFAFHKPRGVVCSTVAEGGATPVTDLLPPEFRGWFAVGRLDKESDGLLLFSDDPVFAQRLMDPGCVPKVYEVVVEGFPDDAALAPMRAGGVELDGRTLRPVEVTRTGKAPRGGTRFRVVLHEGVNREVRRLFRAAGHKVRRLRRISVGPVELGEIKEGEGREISSSERERLQAALAKGAAVARPKHRSTR